MGEIPLTPMQANELGRRTSKAFINAYEKLVIQGHYDSSRALFLSTFPFVMANLPPENRLFALAEMLEVYARVGAEVYEDGEDLYDAIFNKKGHRD